MKNTSVKRTIQLQNLRSERSVTAKRCITSSSVLQITPAARLSVFLAKHNKRYIAKMNKKKSKNRQKQARANERIAETRRIKQCEAYFRNVKDGDLVFPAFPVVVDMKDFYKKLLSYSLEREEAWMMPQVFINHNIPDGINCLHILNENDDGGHAILIDYHSSFTAAIDIAIRELQKEPSQNKDTYNWISIPYSPIAPVDMFIYIAAEIFLCDALNVYCPPLYITQSDIDETGVNNITVNEEGPSAKSLGIILDGNCETLYILKALAHELRHVWQHCYHPELFDSYVFSVGRIATEEQRIKYDLQPAELDANAFAYNFIMSVFGEKLDCMTEWDEVNLEIVKCAEKMRTEAEYREYLTAFNQMRMIFNDKSYK